MARSKASRKWQITINNPQDRGLSHEQIKKNLASITLLYWCMCDEVGKENQTYHTHLYLCSQNAIEFTALHKRFYGAHIEIAKGTSQQNRDYIRKEGCYVDSDKSETNLIDTFEEWGTMPLEKVGTSKTSEVVVQMIRDGCKDIDIVYAYPSQMTKIPHIQATRQAILKEKYAEVFRKLQVYYIYGETGTGKTRSILEHYGYTNVYRVTNYKHPFDGYSGEDVILFDEFRSSLPIADMLKYLEGYPLALPCRFADRQACYTKVFLVSNIPLEEQYTDSQIYEQATWQAFRRRLNSTQEKTIENEIVFYDELECEQEKGEKC